MNMAKEIKTSCKRMKARRISVTKRIEALKLKWLRTAKNGTVKRIEVDPFNKSCHIDMVISDDRLEETIELLRSKGILKA